MKASERHELCRKRALAIAAHATAQIIASRTGMTLAEIARQKTTAAEFALSRIVKRLAVAFPTASPKELRNSVLDSAPRRHASDEDRQKAALVTALLYRR